MQREGTSPQLNMCVGLHVQEGGKAWTVASLEIGVCIEPHRSVGWVHPGAPVVLKAWYLTKPRGEDSYSELGDVMCNCKYLTISDLTTCMTPPHGGGV